MAIRQWARAVVALAVLAVPPAAAQDYPNKPVRIVVGFAAGSVSDLVARALAQKLGPALGQPFIVEVRPGAGSNVAAQHVVRSPKDGHTLFIATSSSTIRGAGPASPGFDFGTDLAPIAPIASAPFVLTAYPGLGAKTVREFIALAKARPDTLTFGGTAAGTTGYLVAQLFNQRAGTHLAIAPYPSTAQATTDLITGRISIAFASVANVLQLMEDGKLTALAVAQDKRAALLPQVPSIDEAGLPGVHARIWIGLLAPAGTPPGIVDMLSKAVNEAIRADDFANQMRLQGMELMGGSPEDFAALIRSDTARWDAVLQGSNLGRSSPQN
ncbi:MAG: tripartite tricarboxylate transporter substrate binding protein [Xanthobacteraceae bacterium]|nr:tripartite tricarboxylate transporter substrate binding protein [Xanthobacteraceae bacterium]